MAGLARLRSTSKAPKGVILGLVPRIQLSTGSGARGWLDGRDKPDHDNWSDGDLENRIVA
jgi:hypothetical protein